MAASWAILLGKSVVDASPWRSRRKRSNFIFTFRFKNIHTRPPPVGGRATTVLKMYTRKVATRDAVETSLCGLSRFFVTPVGAPVVCAHSPRAPLAGLLGAELIFRRSSWMLLAILMRDGCRVKLRLVAPLGEGKRFLAQFPSWRERGSRALLLPPAGLPAVSFWRSAG